MKFLVKLFDKVYTNEVEDVDEIQLISSRQREMEDSMGKMETIMGEMKESMGKMEEGMENMKTMLANLSKKTNVVENEDTQQVPTQSKDQ